LPTVIFEKFTNLWWKQKALYDTITLYAQRAYGTMNFEKAKEKKHGNTA
jgi:hypothetical protein